MERTVELGMRQMGSVTVVDLGESPDCPGDVLLREVLNALVAGGQRQILLNLEEVSLVDSAALSEIVLAQHLAELQGGAVKLLNPSGKLLALIHMSQLSGLFEMFVSEDEALASFDFELPHFGATVVTEPAYA